MTVTKSAMNGNSGKTNGGKWREWFERLRALDDAMNYDPLEDHARRIHRLETELAAMKHRLGADALLEQTQASSESSRLRSGAPTAGAS
ncbi:MAG: hypothetical protein HY243_07630 [Proteobacteria bacterium]|nr:hypothetical protein [Pseudomonadota bacterium]